MRARPISCCFSGHRPGKLPWGDDEGDRRCLALKERLDQWNRENLGTITLPESVTAYLAGGAQE